MRGHGVAAAFCLSLLAVGPAISPARAIEVQAGTANFTAPGSVPNYFSNESGVLQGGAAARAGQQPAVTPRYAAPAPSRREYSASRGRHHAAHGGGRGRSSHASAHASAHNNAHARHGGGHYAQSSRGGSHGSAHASSSAGRGKTAAAKTHPAAAGRHAQARGRG